MADNLAAATLAALVQVPGALKIITSEMADPDGDPYKPATFVIHEVTRIEGPDDRGRLRAYTAEGDWCEGQPEALLKRLQEWRS